MLTPTRQFVPEKLSQLSEAMHAHIDSGEVAGLVSLLYRGSELHVEPIGVMDLESKAPMQRDTIFRIASMSKPVAAVAAMILVEEGKLKLDDSVTPWLPELQHMRVLKSLDSQVDETVPLKRPITLRDLLTFKMGAGFVMAPLGTYPIQKAILAAGLMPSPNPPTLTPDEWMKNFATIPLVYQPGERWMYHTGSDVLSVLVARIAQVSFGNFLHERIFKPLEMNDTAFSVPQSKIARLATSYNHGADQKLAVFDPAIGGKWSSPPKFESGGGGLVSTADDYLAFGRMMLEKGQYRNGRILKQSTVEEMLQDHLTEEEKLASPFCPGFWDSCGWGLGFSLATGPDKISSTPGRFGWNGGLGTTWYSDPVKDLVGILLTQTAWTSPQPPLVCADFWKLSYESLN